MIFTPAFLFWLVVLVLVAAGGIGYYFHLRRGAAPAPVPAPAVVVVPAVVPAHHSLAARAAMVLGLVAAIAAVVMLWWQFPVFTPMVLAALALIALAIVFWNGAGRIVLIVLAVAAALALIAALACALGGKPWYVTPCGVTHGQVAVVTQTTPCPAGTRTQVAVDVTINDNSAKPVARKAAAKAPAKATAPQAVAPQPAAAPATKVEEDVCAGLNPADIQYLRNGCASQPRYEITVKGNGKATMVCRGSGCGR